MSLYHRKTIPPRREASLSSCCVLQQLSPTISEWFVPENMGAVLKALSSCHIPLYIPVVFYLVEIGDRGEIGTRETAHHAAAREGWEVVRFAVSPKPRACGEEPRRTIPLVNLETAAMQIERSDASPGEAINQSVGELNCSIITTFTAAKLRVLIVAVNTSHQYVV